MNKRIQEVSSCPMIKGMGMICVLANTCYNENEMYLANDNTIRREHVSESDPEFILLFDESSELYGLFKKTHTEADSSVVTWEKVY